MSPCRLCDRLHRAVDIGGHTREHVRRRRAEAIARPRLTHEGVIAADATRGDDDGIRLDLKLGDHLTVAFYTAFGVGCGEHLTAHTRDRSTGGKERGHPVPGQNRGATLGLCRTHDLGEGRDDTRPRAPGDVKARHRVARPDGTIAAALGPPHHRKEADAAFAQPVPLLTGSELQIGLCPATRPGVFGAVEAGIAEPVLAGQVKRVADAHAALLGRVDEEQTTERPPRLPAEVREGLLVDDRHAAPRGERFAGCDKPGEPPADHENVGLVYRGRRHHGHGSKSRGEWGAQGDCGARGAADGSVFGVGSKVLTRACAARSRYSHSVASCKGESATSPRAVRI